MKVQISALGILIIFTILFITGCTASKGENNYQILITIDGKIDTSVIEAGPGVTVSLADNKEADAIEMKCGTGNPEPRITFKESDKKWQLLNYKFIAADITNKGETDLLVECRPTGMRFGGQIIPAGKTRSLRTYIMRTEGEYPAYLDKYMPGLRAFPGGIIKAGRTDKPAGSVTSFTISINNPPENTTIVVSNLRAEGSIEFPAEEKLSGGDYFPLVDEFGQLRTREWEGKIYSREELIKAKETESRDIETNPAPAHWNKYGGWSKGPQLKATGHFRTQKIGDKWWLIDPEGRLFWSHGICTITMGTRTPVGDREHLFTLPDSNQYRDFYSSVAWRGTVPAGYYQGLRSVRQFNNYGYNLMLKYGSGWESDYKDFVHKRLSSWGMNTIGCFSAPEIGAMSLTPYTVTIWNFDSRRIEGSSGVWMSFPDPYDESFIKTIAANIKRDEKTAIDPYCIGYFVDNEITWGDNVYLARAVIQSPKDQPAKLEMRNFLKEKYGQISELNSTWKSSYQSWDSFLESQKVPDSSSDDLEAFTRIITEKYFKTVKEELSKVAPDKLYLGCRFSGGGAWLVNIAGKFCDVLTFNRYQYSVGNFSPFDADKPVLVGEWHMGSNDRGMLNFGLRYAEDQQNRAEMYDFYIKKCLQNPFIIGAHWFQFADQPVLGRFDGEDFNVGFLDNCDNPYKEMIAVSRRTGKTMYEIRSAN